MTDNLSIRLIAPSDSPKLQSLITAGAVGGQMSFTYDYLADMVQVSQGLGTDLHGAIAELDGSAIAMVFGDFVPVQWSGAILSGRLRLQFAGASRPPTQRGRAPAS